VFVVNAQISKVLNVHFAVFGLPDVKVAVVLSEKIVYAFIVDLQVLHAHCDFALHCKLLVLLGTSVLACKSVVPDTLIAVEIVYALEKLGSSKLNYAWLVLAPFYGVRLASRCLSISRNHHVVAAKCIGDHSAVLLIKDVLGLCAWAEDSVEDIHVLAGAVGKASVATNSPIKLLLLLEQDLVVGGRVYIYVLRLKPNGNVEVIEKLVQLHFVHWHECLGRI
jgi:hypothetical protein